MKGKYNLKKDELNKKYIIIVSICIILIVIDQITKFCVENYTLENKMIIQNILNFDYVKNQGGAFGIGSSNIIFIILTNIVVIALVIKFMITQQERIDKKTNVMLMFIISGGISNLIDRIIRGYVVDFIDIKFISILPKFNIADIYIVIAWTCLIIQFIIQIIQDKKAEKQEVQTE